MKQLLKRFLSAVLTLTLVLQLCPVYALDTTNGNTTDASNDSSTNDSAVTAAISSEEPTLREENVKHFLMSDGTYTAVRYPFAVHWNSGSGWQDYNNTLKAVKTEAFTGYTIENGNESRSFSTDGTADALYAATTGKTAVSFTLAGDQLNYEVSVTEKTPDNGSMSGFIPENLSSQLTYENILPGLSLTYTVYGPNIKEDILLEAIPDTELSFKMTLDNLTPQPQEDGSILLLDNDGTVVWQIEAPYMYDANGEISYDVHYELKYVEAEPEPGPQSTQVESDAVVPEESGTEDTDAEESTEPGSADENPTGNAEPETNEEQPVESEATIIDGNEDIDTTSISAADVESNAETSNADFTEIENITDDDAQQPDEGLIESETERTETETAVETAVTDEASAPAEPEDYWLLTIAADRSWLESAAYPVTIDPSLTRKTTGTGSSQPIITTFVREKTPNGTGYVNVQYWGWGCTNTTGQLTGIARVNDLPALPAGGVMTSATISYYFDSFSGAGMSSAKLGVREITSDKPSASVTWYSYITGLTWNTRPSIAEDFLDTVVVSNATVGRVTWDITRVVKKWYEDPDSNYGIAFDITNPEACSSSVGACARFYGYNSNGAYPLFTVNYRDTVGLENYYTAQTLPADRAGTVYIGDYTGQITLIRTDAVLASTVMSGSVSHVYNSAFSDAEQPRAMSGTGMQLGKGWSLDAVQSIKTISGVVTYTDGDGTRHAFTRSGSSGSYYDEDGLGLKLTKTASSPETYEMVNDSGDKLKFINGLLFEKTDVYGNKLQYRYNTSSYKPAGTTSDKLNSIVLILNGSSTTATVASFTWNSTGYLSQITDYSGNVTSFTYSNSLLTTVTQPDGKTVTYTYNTGAGNALSTVRDNESQYNLRFEWYGGAVSGWQEYDDDTPGIGVTAERTTKSVEYTFDGRTPGTPKRITVYLFDHAGRSVNCYTRNADGSIVYSASSGEYTATATRSRKNNRITTTGSMGIAENSLLSNGSFESGSTGWSISNGSVASGKGMPGTGGTASRALVLNGNPNINASAYSTASNLNASGRLSYMLSGWAKAAAMPNGGSVTEEVFRLRAVITYGDNTTEEHSQSFNTDVTDWQYLSFAVVPMRTGETVSSITCYCEYLKNNGNACFDNLTLTQEISQTYVYDSNGYVTTVSSGETASPVYSFNSTGDLTSFTSRNGVNYDYTYGSYHNVTSITDGTVTAEYKYDQYGNITETTIYGAGNNGPLEVQNTTFRCTVTANPAAVYSAPNADSVTASTLAIATILTIDALQKTEGVLYGRYGTNLWVNLEDTNYRNTEAIVVVTRSSVNYRGGAGSEYELMGTGLQGDVLAITEVSSSAQNISNKWGKVKGEDYWVFLNYTDYASRQTSQPGGMSCPEYTGNTMIAASVYSTDTGTSLQTGTTNTNGAETAYTYGTNVAKQYGLPTKVTTPDGVSTNTAYNANNGRTTSTSVTGYASLNYTYNENGYLSQLQRSFTRNGSTLTQSYNLTYGSFGDLASVSVGSRTLAEYVHNRYTGDIEKLTYGNGDLIDYFYNEIDQLTSVYYNGTGRYFYSYDNSGQLSAITDSLLHLTYEFQYDSLGRLISSTVRKNGSTILTVSADYDSAGRLSEAVYTVNGRTQHYSCSYNALGLLSTETNPANTVNYSYDGLERLEKLTAGSLYTKNWSYANPAGTAGTTTGLVSVLTYKKSNGTTIADFSYSYDSMGRIVSDGTYHYSYDSLGQLLTVTDNAGHTVESYVYDGAGNILSAVKNGTTHSYSYGDSEWRDLLTSYDGQSITYDAIGNPTGYLGNTLTWQNGRELATFTNSQYSISYSYDVNGLRTEKAVTQSGVTTSYQYFYSGSTLLQERIGNNTIFNFIYTADGKPYALEYSTNGGTSYTTCYYLTNLQGDVVSILDSSGTAVVSYSYDSWGKITQTTGTLATTLGKDNPLRYRGYVYDEETNLYYLQSRYYDPQTCRFINADGYASTGQGLLGTNCFAYCGNLPVTGFDPTGETNWAGVLLGIGMIALGVALVAATIPTGLVAVPVVATVINTASTVLGASAVATGVVTTYAASSDSTMVVDISVVNGSNEKAGYSTVIDFSSETIEVDNYCHYGITTSGASISYGVGAVSNYNQKGDYAGDFIDGGASYTHNGITYGLDTCSSPSTSSSRCTAILFTVGFSVPYSPQKAISGYVGYDYFVPVS